MPERTLTAQAVAELVGGRLSGDREVVLGRVRALERAGPGDLAVCSGPRYLAAMATTRASAIVVPPGCAEAPGPATRIVVDNPMLAIAAVARTLDGSSDLEPGVDPTARIGAGARLGHGVHVGPGVVVGRDVEIGDGAIIGPLVVIEDRVRIGRDALIEPRVVIMRGSTVGNRVHLKAGAMIGGVGFGFHTGPDGRHQRVPQPGGCILEDDVEVGANSCIDRGSLDDTVIGAGTKIDNLVHVAHNVRIGRNCLLMAGVGVSGSTRIGDNVILAGQAGLVGHIELGDGVRVGAQAGVIGSVEAGRTVSGFPARSHREFMRAQAALYRLAPHVAALEALLRREDDA